MVSKSLSKKLAAIGSVELLVIGIPFATSKITARSSVETESKLTILPVEILEIRQANSYQIVRN